VVADIAYSGVAGGRLPSAWIRLAVEAAPNRDAAEEVEVTILRIDNLGPGSVRDPMLSGISLAVSSSPGLNAANVPAGGFRIFDLASTYECRDGKAPLVIEVAPHAKPFDKRNELDWEDIAIELAVTAKNADSSRYLVRIHFDGQWSDQIWADHLKVVELARWVTRGPRKPGWVTVEDT
jgi:hypothetical protein